MKKLIFILMVGSLFAQYLPDVSEMSETEKMLVFENNKKSPALGVLFSLLLPSTGHAYAKNWKRGLAFTGAQLINGGLIAYFNLQAFNKGTCPQGFEKTTTRPCPIIAPQFGQYRGEIGHLHLFCVRSP